MKKAIRNFVAKHLQFGGQGGHVDKAGNKALRSTQKAAYEKDIKKQIGDMWCSSLYSTELYCRICFKG